MPSPDPCPEVSPEPQATTPARRRRLWELPPEAHELLLGLCFEAEDLRREAARVLGRLHHAHCVLQGSASDVLYSVAHDLTRRNALSDRLQALLQLRHAAAEKAVRALRDEAALRAVWQERLQDGDGERIVAAFWALLTHPLGPAVQKRLLFDLKARCWQHSRAVDAQQERRRALEARVTALSAEQHKLQARLNEALCGHQSERQAWALRQAQWNGERARLLAEKGAFASAAAATPGAPSSRPPVITDHPPPTARKERWRHPATPHSAAAQAPTRGDVVTAVPTDAPATLDGVPAATERPMPRPLRHVLCVGGVQHAVPHYREHVERLGARFEHHDGGLEDSLPRLEGHLSRADLVVCQAGCINHEAYHRIKRHCARTGTPCVYLERPSLSRFEAAIGVHLSERGAAAPRSLPDRSAAHG